MSEVLEISKSLVEMLVATVDSHLQDLCEVERRTTIEVN